MRLCDYCRCELADCDAHDLAVMKPVHKLCLVKRRDEPRKPMYSPRRALPASVARVMPRWR